MRKRISAVAVLAVFAMVTGCAVVKTAHETSKGRRTYEPADYGFVPAARVMRDIVYAPGKRGEKLLKLDVHWNPAGSPRPMVIIIHGGGWIIGSKDDIEQEQMAGYIASHGYVVVNVNYRMLPKYTVFDCIRDTFGAVVWAKRHAAEFGGDPERVGAVGFSAGGHLTGMVANAGSRMDIFPPTGQEGARYDASVKVAVPFYGVFDLISMPREPFPLPDFINHLFIKQIFDSKLRDNRVLARKASPVTYISSTTPPQLIICGDADSLKLYPQSVQYFDALKKAGRQVEFIVVPGGDHAFNAHYWTKESQHAHREMIKYFDKFLKSTPSSAARRNYNIN